MARKYASRTTTQRRGLFRKKVHHQKRHATLGDKIAGGLKKLKGTLTRNPAVKVRDRPLPPFLLPSSSLLEWLTNMTYYRLLALAACTVPMVGAATATKAIEPADMGL